MDGSTRFGKYVLLKKLGEHALGETYRAAELDGDAIKTVVLLHLFTAPGIDAETLMGAARARGQAPAHIGPGLALARETGSVEGLTFAAYDYAPGRDLPTLLTRANDGFSTLNVEQAVLIVERIAKGLASLHNAGDAACHGFLVPQLVDVTTEGETKVLGYELGPGLARLAAAGRIDPALVAYLSPEVVAGQPPGRSDDLYSLGAILLELLTGRSPAVGEDLAGLLDHATLVGDGTPLSPGLVDLIAKSVAPRTARVATAGAWHQALSAWMSETSLTVTNFDLAFFVHELFRDELKREDQEVAQAKAAPTPPPPSAPPPVPASAPVATAVVSGAVPAGAVASGTVAIHQAASGPVATPGPATGEAPSTASIPTQGSQSGGKRGLFLGLAALVAAALAAFFFLGRGGEAEPTSAAASQPVPPVATPTEVVVPAEPVATEAEEGDDGSTQALTLEAASAELDRLMQERADALEAQLASEYDAEIQGLREQLAAAQAVEAQAQASLEAGTTATPDELVEAASQAGEVEASAVQQPEPAAAAPVPEPAPAERVTPPVESAAQALTDSGPADEASQPEPPRQSPTPAEPAVSSPPSTPVEEVAPQPAQPVVRPPKLVRNAKPQYPAQARLARKAATIVVKVLVGTDGRVQEAALVSKKRIGYGLDEAALRAARRAVFQPATVDGRATSQWTTMVMRFEP